MGDGKRGGIIRLNWRKAAEPQPVGMDDGYWRDVLGEPEPRSCGNCAHCLRHDEKRHWTYDPWPSKERDGEEYLDAVRDNLGICVEEGQDPWPVKLWWKDDQMPCCGDAWEESRWQG